MACHGPLSAIIRSDLLIYRGVLKIKNGGDSLLRGVVKVKRQIPLKVALLCLYLLVGALLPILAKSQALSLELSEDFAEIAHLVQSAYVDDVKLSPLMPAVFQKVLETVDGNASYIPGDEVPSFDEVLLFSRTGLTLAKRNGIAYVLAVAEGSPAEKAGIAAKGFIQKINQVSTREMSCYQIKKHLMIEEVLVLQFLEAWDSEARVIELQMGSFSIPKLTYELVAESIYFLKLPCFYPNWESDLEHVLGSMKDDAKVLLDLRNNAIGSDVDLERLAGFFLPKGVVATRLSPDHMELPLLVNQSPGTYAAMPLFLVLDQTSSKAAERFGAIAQDLKVAWIIGSNSLGYSDYFQFLPLKFGGFAHVPTHKLKLRSGATLTQNGVQPNLAWTPGQFGGSPEKSKEVIRFILSRSTPAL